MTKKLREKYPWMTFEVNLKGLSLKTWTQLGECLSKCEHLSQVPLKPQQAQKMHLVYLAKGAQATTAIEGNTLSEEEVILKIEDKLELPPSKEYLGQEVENILTLCNEIGSRIREGKESIITIEGIWKYNKIILNNVPLPVHVIPGKFRQHTVGVGNYKAPDYQDVTPLMGDLCNWLNSSYFESNEIHPIISSIIKAVIAHLYIAWIHPFGDGNGRVGRILEFDILLNSGVPSPAAHLFSNHYNATRNEYYIQLDLSSKKRNVHSFISYAVQGFLDGLKDQQDYIFNQTLDIFWESHIYEIFGDETTGGSKARAKRLRSVMLELSKQKEPVSLEKLFILNQDIINCYRNKANITLKRDLVELLKLDLIKEVDKGLMAKKEKILAFLPMSSKL